MPGCPTHTFILTLPLVYTMANILQAALPQHKHIRSASPGDANVRDHHRTTPERHHHAKHHRLFHPDCLRRLHQLVRADVRRVLLGLHAMADIYAAALPGERHHHDVGQRLQRRRRGSRVHIRRSRRHRDRHFDSGRHHDHPDADDGRHVRVCRLLYHVHLLH